MNICIVHGASNRNDSKPVPSTTTMASMRRETPPVSWMFVGMIFVDCPSEVDCSSVQESANLRPTFSIH